MEEEFIPVEGRSVVYRISEDEWRPAQIVRVWSTSGLRTANLVVFLDGSNDRAVSGVGLSSEAPLIMWRTSVYYGDKVNQYLPRKPNNKENQ